VLHERRRRQERHGHRDSGTRCARPGATRATRMRRDTTVRTVPRRRAAAAPLCRGAETGAPDRSLKRLPAIGATPPRRRSVLSTSRRRASRRRPCRPCPRRTHRWWPRW
jgi:hypothetical protein